MTVYEYLKELNEKQKLGEFNFECEFMSWNFNFGPEIPNDNLREKFKQYLLGEYLYMNTSYEFVFQPNGLISMEGFHEYNNHDDAVEVVEQIVDFIIDFFSKKLKTAIDKHNSSISLEANYRSRNPKVSLTNLDIILWDETIEDELKINISNSFISELSKKIIDIVQKLAIDEEIQSFDISVEDSYNSGVYYTSKFNQVLKDVKLT